MKKVFSFAAIAALTMFAASCGNDAELKRKADSAHMADSLALVQAQWKADSAHTADSVAAAQAAAEALRIADSTRVADSIAASKKGGKKTPPKPVIPKGEPKVGGKR